MKHVALFLFIGLSFPGLTSNAQDKLPLELPSGYVKDNIESKLSGDFDMDGITDMVIFLKKSDGTEPFVFTYLSRIKSYVPIFWMNDNANFTFANKILGIEGSALGKYTQRITFKYSSENKTMVLLEYGEGYYDENSSEENYDNTFTQYNQDLEWSGDYSQNGKKRNIEYNADGSPRDFFVITIDNYTDSYDFISGNKKYSIFRH
jgi:hypothetical protein